MNNIKCDENCAECKRYTTVMRIGNIIKYDCLITGKTVKKEMKE